jgi:hypothetical protein
LSASSISKFTAVYLVLASAAAAFNDQIATELANGYQSRTVHGEQWAAAAVL